MKNLLGNAFDKLGVREPSHRKRSRKKWRESVYNAMEHASIIMLLGKSGRLKPAPTPPKYQDQRIQYMKGAWLGDDVASAVPTKAHRDERRRLKGDRFDKHGGRKSARLVGRRVR